VGRSPDVLDAFGALPAERVTLAEQLQAQGYATGAVINNTFLAPEFGVHQGFSKYMYRGADNTDFRSAAATNKRALDWLSEVKEQPAFLVVHYMEPHMDLIPASGVRGRYADTENPLVPVPFRSPHAYELTQDNAKRAPEVVDYVKALYDEEVLDTDAAFGQLLNALKKRPRWDDTVLIITSDHGEEFWDHGEFEHGHTLRSVITQVPLIVNGPGFHGMGKKQVLVEHVDLFQGILALAGAPSPEGTNGSNIFEVAKQDPDTERWSLSENTLYGEPMISVVTPSHRLLLNQHNGVAALWETNESGGEGAVVPQESQQAIADPILGSIRQLRGHFKPMEQVAGPKVPSQDTFQQLKSLGYIE
jgi:arylsulfatase A-like enzyme